MKNKTNQAYANFFGNANTKQMWHMLPNKDTLGGSSDDTNNVNVNAIGEFFVQN